MQTVMLGFLNVSLVLVTAAVVFAAAAAVAVAALNDIKIQPRFSSLCTYLLFRNFGSVVGRLTVWHILH